MKPGTLVLCVMNHSFDEQTPGGKENINLKRNGYIFPIKDTIYVVRGDNETGGVWLEEIVNPKLYHTTKRKYVEVAFGYWAFREIQPPMTIKIEELVSETIEI